MKKYGLSFIILMATLSLIGCGVDKDKTPVKNKDTESESVQKKATTSKKRESAKNESKKSESKKDESKNEKTSSAEETSSNKTQEKFMYSLIGTWYSTDSKTTYSANGTLKQVSDASGMTNEGTYKIISQTKDSLTVQQTITVKGSGENVQNETFKFSDASQFNDGLVTWKK